MITTTRLEFTHKESTKYSVNGIDCNKNSIHQTILQNNLAAGTITIKKKYHSAESTKIVVEQSKVSINKRENFRSSYTSKSTTNDNASVNQETIFHLDTSKFVKKFNSESNQFKLLISKMIDVVDLLYDAQNDYPNHSHKLNIAIRDCTRFFFENTSNSKARYNDILHAFTIEHLVFIFDMLAFTLAYIAVIPGKNQIPSPALDMGSIEEKWNEDWSDKTKSEYLDNYLAVALNQIELLSKLLGIPDNDEVKTKFDHFKKFIIDLQVKKRILDVSLLNMIGTPIVAVNPASLFHFNYQHPSNNRFMIVEPTFTERFKRHRLSD